MKAITKFGVMLAIGATGGCVSPANPSSSSATRIDQLKQFYRELEGGRFAVIADFEEPKQMEIFQFANPNKNSKLVLEKKHGRAETGPACLAFTPSTPDDVIVVSNTNAQQWYLKRDWQSYNLLMISVFSPLSNATLDMTIATGQGASRQSMHSASTLNQGWNLLRLDLADLSEHLPMDDVQELRLRMETQGKPQTFYFDDLLLVDSRQPLLGETKGPAGDLYAVQAGRRLIVGTGGRFEITFAHGQIVQWFNLATDPNRLVNLVEGTSLGPFPIALENTREKTDGTGSGKRLAVRQRIVELSRVRAVIESEWTGDANADSHLVTSNWTYTIYPTGQMYVEFSCTQPEALSLGMFISLSAPRPDEVEVTTSRSLESPQGSDATPWILAHVRSVDAALLFVPEMNWGDILVKSNPEPEHRQIVLTAKVAKPREQTSWSAHLFLSSSALNNTEAERRAIDYNHPVPWRFEVGKPATEFIDVGHTDGFDAAMGCFTIDADAGRARLAIDGRSHRLNSPAFRIRQTRAENAWVYVNHLILERVERTDDGDVIFQIPREISELTEVEVLTRGRTLPLTHPAK